MLTDQCNGFAVQNAAGSHSALCSGVATVIFTGIVLVLSFRLRADVVRRRLALLTMVPTFLVLLVASLMSSEVAGLVDCRQAAALSIPFSLLFGIGGLGTFQAVAWLLSAYDETPRELEILGAAALVSVLALAYAQIYITIFSGVVDLDFVGLTGVLSPANFVAVFGSLTFLLSLAKVAAHLRSRRTQPLPWFPWPSLVSMIVGMVVTVALFDALIAQGPESFVGSSPEPLVTATYWVIAVTTVIVLPVPVLSWRPSTRR